MSHEQQPSRLPPHPHHGIPLEGPDSTLSVASEDLQPASDISAPRKESRGCLHLQPCTFEGYVGLGYNADDRYDLVEGILIWDDDMPDPDHHKVIEGAAELLKSGIRRTGKRDTLRVHAEAEVDVTPVRTDRRYAENRSSLRLRRIPLTHRHSSDATVRHVDLMVHIAGLDAERGNVSPSSQKIYAPRGLPPFLIVEVTSTRSSRHTDVDVKWQEYTKCGIHEYVIIDRKVDTRGDPSIIVGTLQYDITGKSLGTYSRADFQGDDIVQCSFLRERGCTAAELFNPPSPQWTASSPERRERRLKDAAEGRVRVEILKRIAAEEAAREERRKRLELEEKYAKRIAESKRLQRSLTKSDEEKSAMDGTRVKAAGSRKKHKKTS